MNSMIRILLLLAICSTHSAHERFWYPYHDGTSRVVRLTPDTLQSTLQNKNIVVVHFELVNEQNEKGKNEAVNRMLETTAQVLENNQVVVGVYNIAEGASSAEEGLQQPGAIKVYRQGKPYEFNGYHLPETLLSFINKVNSTSVTQIANKQDKKLFENYEGAKVIGFFQQESGAYKFYEQAAEFFHPNVPFFVVFDQLIANSLRCKGTGIVEIVLPFRKERIQCPQIPATTEEIVSFVQENRASSLLKITKENVHSLWGERENNVVAFYSASSPAGRSFFKILKGRARYCNATAIPMLAIDTDQFPMLIDVWQSLLKIDLSQPNLGFVNSKTYEASWMDISTLSTMTPVNQSRAIQQWMQDIDDGLVVNDGTELAPSLEDRKPVACQEKVEKVKKNEREAKKEEKVEEVKNAQQEESAAPSEVEVEKTEPEVKKSPQKEEVKTEKKVEKSQTEEKKQVEKKNEKKSEEKIKKPESEEKEEQKKKVENRREEKSKKSKKVENKEEQNEKKVEKENSKKSKKVENKEEQNEKKVEKEKYNKNKKYKKNDERKNERKEKENEEREDKSERKDKRQNKDKKYKNEKNQQKSKKNKK